MIQVIDECKKSDSHRSDQRKHLTQMKTDVLLADSQENQLWRYKHREAQNLH